MPWRSRSRQQSGDRQALTPAPAATSAPGFRGARLPRGTVVVVALAAVTVTAVGMNGIRGILAPVLLTLILTICANPVRSYLQRRGVPQSVATGSVIVLMFALLAGFTLTLVIAVGQFVAMLPGYAAEFEEIRVAVGSWLKSLGISEAQVSAVVAGIDPHNLVAFVSGALGGVFSITGNLVIVLTMMILMSADAVYAPTILRQLGQTKPHLVSALNSYASNVRRYMVVTTVLGVAQGGLNALALWLLNVPAALLWGLLAFLCSFIPNVGYFFAIIPPLVFGFFVGGWPTALLVFVVYGVINAVVQSIIQPRVVGQVVSLSQTVTFFSVLFWAVVIGPIGAILAIPLTLLGKAVLVDSDPGAHLWRPAFGPTAETRGLKRSEDAEQKQRRRLASRASAPDSRPGAGKRP